MLYNAFFIVPDAPDKLATVFAPGETLQLSLIFTSKARAYLNEEPFMCSTQSVGSWNIFTKHIHIFFVTYKWAD